MKREKAQRAMTVNSERHYYFDVLRGLAVLFMISQHLVSWLWSGPGYGETLYNSPLLVTLSALGGLAAPLFITLAGVGSGYLIAKLRAQGRSIKLLMLRRGVGILCFAYILNMATPSWFSWQSWFVLHLIGVGMIFLIVCSLWSKRSLFLFSVVVLFVTPLLQAALDTPALLSNARMAGWLGSQGGGSIQYAFVRLALVEGHFPVFPWLSFFVLGYLLSLYPSAHSSLILKKFFGFSLVCVLLFMLLGQWQFFSSGVLSRYFTISFPFFPASLIVILGLMSAVAALFWAGLKLEEEEWITESMWLVAVGRCSLTVFLAHVVIFRELSASVGWFQVFNSEEVIAIILISVLAVACLAVAWKKVGFRYGAEWVLRKIY